MKKWMVTATLALSGCAQLTNYDQAVKTPAPAELQGNWQTSGPQNKLLSPEAIGSLIITPEGDTLDCRQWRRVIAKPGKLTRLGGDIVSVNRQLRVMPLELEDNQLHYDGLTLRRTDSPTLECQQALQQMKDKPDAKIFQDIEPQVMRATFADGSRAEVKPNQTDAAK